MKRVQTSALALAAALALSGGLYAQQSTTGSNTTNRQSTTTTQNDRTSDRNSTTTSRDNDRTSTDRNASDRNSTTNRNTTDRTSTDRNTSDRTTGRTGTNDSSRMGQDRNTTQYGQDRNTSQYGQDRNTSQFGDRNYSSMQMGDENDRYGMNSSRHQMGQQVEVDLVDQRDKLIALVDVPGTKKNAIQVSVDGRQLTVSGSVGHLASVQGSGQQGMSQNTSFHSNQSQTNQNYRSSTTSPGQTGSQYGQSGQQYGQSGSQYRQDNQPYGQSGQQYGQTGQQYGQSGQQFGQQDRLNQQRDTLETESTQQSAWQNNQQNRNTQTNQSGLTPGQQYLQEQTGSATIQVDDNRATTSNDRNNTDRNYAWGTEDQRERAQERMEDRRERLEDRRDDLEDRAEERHERLEDAQRDRARDIADRNDRDRLGVNVNRTDDGVSASWSDSEGNRRTTSANVNEDGINIRTRDRDTAANEQNRTTTTGQRSTMDQQRTSTSSTTTTGQRGTTTSSSFDKQMAKVQSQQVDGRVIQQERYTGYFSRTITLPTNVREDQVTAKLEDGILRIELPKDTTQASARTTTTSSGPRQIEIQ